MDPGTVTHQYAMNRRALTLEFIQPDATTVEFQSPYSANIMPPGYYLLFIVSNSGAYSTGSWVHVGPILAATNTIPHGTYVLHPNNGGANGAVGPKSGTCMDIRGYSSDDDALAQTYSCKGQFAENQRFLISNHPLGGTLVTLQAQVAWKCLYAAANGQVEQQDCNGSQSQAWTLNVVDIQAMKFTIKSSSTGQCAAILGNSQSGGTPITLQDCTDTVGGFIWTLDVQDTVDGRYMCIL